MTHKKSHVHNGITFGFAPQARKWTFQAGQFEFLSPAPGGIDTARKIAGQVSGAQKRAAKRGETMVALDNLARTQIASIVG